MRFVVMDLEWNGAYCRQTRGYFNEIIEIGAVRLDGGLRPDGEFHAVIRPQVSSELSSIVRDLTSITPEELEEQGKPFPTAMEEWIEWIGDEETVILTWSTTDLLVMMENCRYYYDDDRLPFMERYADLQAYCQQRMGVGTAQQVALNKACDMLGISEDGAELHRALDDSRLSGRILQRVYEPDSFAEAVREADQEFYDRLHFKTTVISDIDSPLVKRSELQFRCPFCNRNMRRSGEWRFRSRAFCAEFLCRGCGRTFTGRAQFKLKFDGVEIKRRLVERIPSQPDKEGEAADG